MSGDDSDISDIDDSTNMDQAAAAAATAASAALVANIEAAGTAAAASIARVGLKLPVFWLTNPNFWFTQAEVEFDLNGITVQRTKWQHMVRSLDGEVANQVRKQVETPTAGSEYNDLKKALLAAYDKSKRTRAARLADMGGLGNKRPSFLLNEMKALLGSEEPGILFLHHFLSNLPDDIRVALAKRDGDADELAAAADSMWEEKALNQQPSLVAAIKTTATSAKAAKATKSDVCYYHETYGNEAKKCRPWCKFSKSGNASASQ
jgi:hypothetical protein